MASASVWLLCFAIIGVFVVAVRSDNEIKCGKCELDRCPRPTNCRTGMVLDHCGCCRICGRVEGEKCDNDTLPLPYRNTYGSCGDGLECRLRDDLQPSDPLEAICVCVKQEVLCGSDGKTYMNLCLLMEEAYRLRNGLKAASRGPCKSAPWVVSGPEDQEVARGSNVALSCEGMGFPIPSIEWQMTKNDGTLVDLPSDDQHVAVQARGGPERFELTAWLQILDFQEEDDGVYHCIVTNIEGEAKASAKLTLVEFLKEDAENELEN
ncbi:hypothetical protein CHUAL_008547 [Chamberlinius hualienensis]